MSRSARYVSEMKAAPEWKSEATSFSEAGDQDGLGSPKMAS